MTIKNKTIFVAFALFCTCLNADPTFEELQAALAVNLTRDTEIGNFGINEVNGLVDEAKLSAEDEVKNFTNKIATLPSEVTKEKEKSATTAPVKIERNPSDINGENLDQLLRPAAYNQQDQISLNNHTNDVINRLGQGAPEEETEEEALPFSEEEIQEEEIPEEKLSAPAAEQATVVVIQDQVVQAPRQVGGSNAERNFSFENTYITRNSARVVQNAISNRMLYKISANEPIWVSINYSNSKQNETVGLGYKADTIGAVIGYDFINDSEMSFGAVAAFEVTDIDYSGKYSDKNANGKQYSGFAGLYGSYTDGCFDIYASSLLGYTNYKLNRLLENETSKLAHSKYSGLSFCNKVSTDYMFETESFRFGPEASLYIDVVNQKKSTEKTATYTVNHNSNTDVYVSGEFGVKVIGKSKSAEKILVPHAFVGFYADLYKDNSKRKCHDNSGNVVKETFNNKKHHYFVVKSGFDINVNDYISASIDYVGYISNNVITNEIAAAVSYKF